MKTIVILALLQTHCFALDLPKGVTQGPAVEGITEYRLDNGLKVLLFPDSTKPAVTVNVTYLAGSRNENYGETGMAHLLEHLMFKGSKKHPDVPQELTAHGADANGTTSNDRTNYYETMPSKKENLEWALDLEADRMVNSFIEKKDLDSEMTVVRNEFESGENSPSGILWERVYSTAFLWHNYGHNTIGAKSDIENVDIGRLQAFYRNWYQPDDAVLVVAGDFDPAETLKMISAKFGAIPRPARAIQKTYTQDPVQDGERQVTLRRVGDTQVVMAGYHVPAASHPESAALELAAYMLGDTPSGRLYKNLVVPGKAASAYAYDDAMRETGLLVLSATVRKEGSLEEARDILLKTAETEAPAGFTKDELERARAALLKSYDLAMRKSDRLGVSLSEYLAAGDWRLFFISRDRIKAATLAEVNAAAAKYLKASNRTLGLFYPTDKPDRAEVPPMPDTETMVKDYKGGEALAEGEAFDASPENIDARTQRSRLAGGLKLALLPKKTRGSSVRVSFALQSGTLEAFKGLGPVPDLAGEMLMRGTQAHTRQQIEDEFDRLKTRASVPGRYFTLETDRENLEPALRLAAEILRTPSFPEAEFATLKQEDLAWFEEQKSQPDKIVYNAYLRHMWAYPPDDPRYRPTPDEEISRTKAATLDQVKAFHRDFYGASNAQLAVVGDFDPAAVKKLAEELFGGWASPQPYRRIESRFQEAPPADLAIETPDKANAVMMLGCTFPMRDDDPDYPALQLAGYMTGGGFLNSRLASRIRQKDGLSYGVSAGFSADDEDPLGQFYGSAIFNPANSEKLVRAFREELERIAKDGFTEKELAEAKSGLLQDRKLERANDAGLANTLRYGEYLGRTMAWYAAEDAKIAALTPEQVKGAFNRHMDLTKLTFVRAGDFAGAAKAAAEKK